MVSFGEYKTPMDRPIEQIDISSKDIGISMGIGDPWVNIKTAVTAGASHVELGFMGMGKGSINSPTGVTPEIIGKDKREDIRQFAKINRVKLSTHASANVIGFTGLKDRGFNEEARAMAQAEVRRAIDFAADVAEGGPVVIHTGEFPRAIIEAPGEKFGTMGKERREEEEKKAMAGLVDKRTGEIMATFTQDIKVPVPDRNKDGSYKLDKEGRIIFGEEGYQHFMGRAKETGIPAEKLFYEAIQERQRLQAQSEELRMLEGVDQMKKQLELFQGRQKDLEDQKRKNPRMAKYWAIRYAEEMRAAPMQGTKEYKEFLENPFKFVDKSVKDFEAELKHRHEYAESYGRQRREIELKMQDVTTLRDYGVDRATESIAEMGMYAFDVEKKKNLKKPLFIAPENIFAEQYGSHPQELKNLIIKSRKKMAEMLRNRNQGISKAEAEKIAADRIKATFDVGHANTWRKYFQGSDKDFNKWLLKETDDLIKNNIIGHVHLTDNFGYHDEHLSPGQGNVPMKEFIEKIKKAGLQDEMIVEPGGQGEGESIYGSMFATWAKAASSPIYRVGPVSKSWTDIEGSYFGRTFTPNYLAGTYLINPQSEDNWYSGVGLE
ncbi:MAG: TIM barrel protein [Candidatus Woesearchaeota archaeon]